ncbi:MAG: D-aminoacylase [Marinibacterium sp.]|nr:D-aminoacylase [Marinibacterium sp.]
MHDCDLLIRGGLVFDGSGAGAVRADIAVEAGQIVEVGACASRVGRQEVDATGLAVAPGFIDVHTHDDWAVLATPDMACKITQGVTTVVAGNCGISAAPFEPSADLPAPFTLLPGATHKCASVGDYARRLAGASPSLNVALLVGHSTLRANVMGGDLNRAATGDEIARMARMLDGALAEGAVGLSSGLAYPSAIAAPMDEVVPLARILKDHPRSLYATHMRDEGDGVLASVRETIETGAQSGAAVVISHHKCSGKANFGRSAETLPVIDAARAHQAVGLDVYPYTASSTALLVPMVRQALSVKVLSSVPYPEMGGRMLEDIAAQWGVDREDAARELSPAAAIYFAMDEGDLRRIMAYPHSMIGSDGTPGVDSPHPRLWGTFPRVLGHYVRAEKLLTLAQAVRKMTGLSADTFGFTDRGYLREGLAADIVLFDPETVIDRATYDAPERPSDGIVHVVVNGMLVLSEGQMTGDRGGRMLRH